MFTKLFDTDITIETSRLTLSSLKDSDAEDIFEIFSDKQVMQFYDLLPFETLDRAKEQVKFFTNGYEQKQMIRWGIRYKENGKLIGTCGFFAFNEDAEKAELGYELNSSYQGKGIMTEAISEALAFLFKQTTVNRVEAYVEPENIPSQKLLEKLGFTKEGTLRKFERCRGELIDICVFGLLRNETEY